jgi:hypothetical protein
MNPLAAKIIKSFRFLDEETTELIFHDNTDIDLDGIIAVADYCRSFTNGKRIKRLTISGKNSNISAKARNYGEKLSEADKDNIIAEAVVVHSLTQKMVANFYFKYLKDLYPARFFTDADKAKEWLAKIGTPEEVKKK